ncbi:unnamed protein product, partial [Owenia fusiformis]
RKLNFRLEFFLKKSHCFVDLFQRGPSITPILYILRYRSKMSEKQTPSNLLEQFVLLAKSAKGAAAVDLVKQVLETPGVYVFGELLDMPNIQQLSEGPNQNIVNLLNIFAYGVYNDYKSNKANLPDLTPKMLKKLRQLTIVSLATQKKCIPYAILQQELEMSNVRELEDLIIEVVYSDIVRGKLDQKNQRLEVDYAIGRDVRAEQVNDIVTVLSEWCSGCEAVLQGIETQVNRANTNREKSIQQKQKVEIEVANIKKTLKATQQTDMDEADSREVIAQLDKPMKKASKTKGLRGSGKFWGKSSS